MSSTDYIDKKLEIRAKPDFYDKLESYLDGANDGREYEANKRLDVIRKRLVEYFNFYNCHNGDNEFVKETVVLNKYDDDGKLIIAETKEDEVEEDGTSEIVQNKEEEYLDLSSIDVNDFVENRKNTDDTFIRNEKLKRICG